MQQPITVEEQSTMTVEGYKSWIVTRGPAGTWDIAKCYAADRLVREETLKNVKEKLLPNVPVLVRDYLICSIAADFGNVECDAMLDGLGLYPEWMARDYGDS